MSTLPIYQVESECVDAVRHHRVVVVEGSTGSGKTTQLPRILLRALNPRCIAVTQPRRIAAVSVAWRIAAEEQVEVGAEVGFAIRFDDQSSGRTRIKLMTDGLLLSEARADPELGRYDVIMIDEVHERSLNIDVTLGLLYRLLQRREDLRVVISSATLAPERYQAFFAAVVGEVPLLRIPSPAHPVDIAYRPPAGTRAHLLVDHLVQLIQEIDDSQPAGHVLVFLAGEGLIRRVATALSQGPARPGLVVLPLYGRLTRSEQERVFDNFGAKRKVILATNIAETSITIPQVRYVLDLGTAKVPRFRPRSGITELREELVSRASVTQRSGRAGRTGPGMVWRVYEESSLAARAEHTEEEILRVDLAEVVMRLLDLGVTDVQAFPFLSTPPAAKLRAAVDHLVALGAVERKGTALALTRIGRCMAPFPLRPALARMVIEAAERVPAVVDDVLIVGAFMSGRSPWILPEGEFDQARAAHRRLHHPMGDACTLLRAYRGWQKVATKAQDKYCTRHYLDAEVMRFTNKAHLQLRELAAAQGIELRADGPAEEVVQALAAGLADKVLRRDGSTYETCTGDRLALHPSSSLIHDPPDFALAAEFVAFARPYAMTVSRLRPSWIAAVNPQAAQVFGLGRLRQSRPAPLTEITLGSVVFAVAQGSGKPTIEVDLSQLAGLGRVELDGLPPGARGLRLRVRWTKTHCFPALRLPRFVHSLARTPYPPPGSTPPRDIRLGDLHEVDRGRHHIGEGLKRLLQPATVGKSAGWVALVANRAGGYWLDVITDFDEAVATSLTSLGELADELYEADELLGQVQRCEKEVGARATAKG